MALRLLAAVAVGALLPLTVGARSTATAGPGTSARAVRPAGAVAVRFSTLLPANGDSDSPAFSADGRFVAFGSYASNLLAGNSCRRNPSWPTCGPYEVFARDRLKGTSEKVSVGVGGAQANATSSYPSAALSADGRSVAFSSDASNLVARDTNEKADVFVRDRLRRTTQRVSVAGGGAQAGGDSFGAGLSADGRFVAFSSDASNLVVGDTNGVSDVFVRDRLTGTTERVSVTSGGEQASGGSGGVAISADGRLVAFGSYAPNLVAGDTSTCKFEGSSEEHNCSDVFVHDRHTQTTERVSVSGSAAQVNGDSDTPAISADGRFVAFSSDASNLVADDTNFTGDVFVRDRLAGTTERVSVGSGGEQANGGGFEGSISADGRFVAFSSDASNLVAGDTNGMSDVFVRDRLTGTTERVSLTSSGRQANFLSEQPAISGDGRFVAFTSWASNLVAGDTSETEDVFVRDRLRGTTELVSVGHAPPPPRAGRLALRPWPARAGRQLAAAMPLSVDGAPLATARVACTATLGDRKLPASRRSFESRESENVATSIVHCAWRIPAGARGTSITGFVAATTAGGTASRRFVGTVR